ncbi:MAG: Na/Pi cotransporter family protein, partial [Deltaproteobacteria bacterium]|nr:Na/Pi cotransporter family protein [Deltaproteobacteria bacterium]
TEQQLAQEMALLGVGDDLEGIGDILSKELGRLAQKKIKTGRVFSKEGWEDIQKLHRVGVENFETALAAFTSPSEELVLKIKHQAWHFKELQQEFRIKHIQRLHEKKPESVETSSLHLDVLVNLRRISDHLVRLGELTLKT